MQKKIRINREVNKKTTKKSNNIRKKISNKIRMALVGIFTIILLFSVISLANAYQKPVETQTSVASLLYNQVGNYNYIAYLNESILYEGIEILKTGDETIFKELVRNINASFTYTLITNKNSEISGSYTITAQITTELWNKTYTIVSDTPFNSNGTTAIFFKQFPIDYVFYENITSQIEEETDVTVSDPKLIIKANIRIDIKNGDEIISETLTPSLTVSLKEQTIDIEIGSDNKDSGEGIPIIEETTNQDVIDERNTWTIFSLIFLVLLILSAALTKSDEDLTTTGKANKKIMKKYKEWIVDVNKEPKKAGTDILQVNSFEDLMKISEELGKPVLHYSTQEDNHLYYVLDESITYQFSISRILWEKNKK